MGIQGFTMSETLERGRRYPLFSRRTQNQLAEEWGKIIPFFAGMYVVGRVSVLRSRQRTVYFRELCTQDPLMWLAPQTRLNIGRNAVREVRSEVLLCACACISEKKLCRTLVLVRMRRKMCFTICSPPVLRFANVSIIPPKCCGAATGQQLYLKR